MDNDLFDNYAIMTTLCYNNNFQNVILTTRLNRTVVKHW